MWIWIIIGVAAWLCFLFLVIAFLKGASVDEHELPGIAPIPGIAPNWVHGLDHELPTSTYLKLELKWHDSFNGGERLTHQEIEILKSIGFMFPLNRKDH